jgi:hypothetical protein
VTPDQLQQLVNKNQGSLTAQEVIREIVNAVMSEFHFAMPGIVVAYHPEDDTADIQPAFNRQFLAAASPTPYKPIPRVPVWYLGPSKGWIHFALAAGDPVLLVFNERNIDTWWTTGSQAVPPDQRMLGLSDAICLPGWRPNPQKITLKGAPDSFEMAFGTAWIEMTAAGKFKMENAGASLKGILSDIVSMMSNASTSPSGGPIIFTFPNPGTVNGEIVNLLA